MQKIDELKEAFNKHGIYAIKCVPSGKLYIGSAHKTENGNSIQKRFWKHLNDLNKNKHANSMLQRAWNKYGEENFEFYLVEIIDDNEIILEREQYWMDFYNSYNSDNGFNLCPTAGSTYNFKWNDESKLNFRGENHPMYGRKHTEESRKKMSESLTGLMVGEKHPNFGKPMPEDLKEKLRELSCERKGELNPMYGKEHIDETKQKISETKKVNYVKEEHPMYGKQHKE